MECFGIFFIGVCGLLGRSCLLLSARDSIHYISQGPYPLYRLHMGPDSLYIMNQGVIPVHRLHMGLYPLYKPGGIPVHRLHMGLYPVYKPGGENGKELGYVSVACVIVWLCV